MDRMNEPNEWTEWRWETSPPLADVTPLAYRNVARGGKASTRTLATTEASSVSSPPGGVEPQRIHALRRYVAPAARDAVAPSCVRADVRLNAPPPPTRNSTAPRVSGTFRLVYFVSFRFISFFSLDV